MINHVTIHTPKLAESVAFYEWLLGLPIASRLSFPDAEIVFMGSHETKLEFIQDENALPIDAPALSVGFAVESLEAKLALLDSKGIKHSEIISPGPGIRFAFFNDLNGCLVQLAEG